MEVSLVASNLSGPIDLHEAAALCTKRGFFNTGFCDPTSTVQGNMQLPQLQCK